MANGYLGVPQTYTVTTNAAAPAYPVTNLTNDEPGLIFQTGNIAAGATFNIDADLAATSDPVSVVFMQGLYSGTPFEVQITSFASAVNRTNNTAPTVHRAYALSPFSANRSNPLAHKLLSTFAAATANKYFRITVRNPLGVAYPWYAWRLLFCKKIQPPDNLEVGAGLGIDDRSERRYSRGGRRNIDPTVIVPTFSGGWPWIDVAQMRADFRPLMLQRGASLPCLFVMDSDEITWGEDEIIYGDLEKTQSITYEDGYLFSYFFNIVGIAP